MENKSSSAKSIIALTIGEIAVSVLVCLVYFIISLVSPYEFSYKVITGAALGSAVTVANFIFLTVSVNRAVDRYLALRGSREMDEEEAEKFAQEHAMAVQNAATRSFIVRTVTMLAALVLAFITGWFEPIATVIPLLMFRPIIYVLELIKKKGEKSA